MKPLGPRLPATGAPRIAPTVATRGEDATAAHFSAQAQLQSPDAPRDDTRLALGGGLPPATLARHLDVAMRAFDAIAARPVPNDVDTLARNYSELGHAIKSAEASLLSALDALDPHTGGGTADPAAPFEDLKERGFRALRRAGEVFATLEPGFKKLVHGPGGWPPRPIDVAPDRGDGHPLRNYENTFKLARDLTLSEKQAEYGRRVDKYRAQGGDPSALRLTTADDIAAMTHNVRYDYVMLADGERMRMVPREGPGATDPGHSLLAAGGDAFVDQPVLLAGEIWALRDSAGDLEAIVVANNSGHFKPEYEDLANAVPLLAKLGIPPEKVVLFGGPNNLPAMFDEMQSRAGLQNARDYLPPSTDELLASWRDAPVHNALSVRF